MSKYDHPRYNVLRTLVEHHRKAAYGLSMDRVAELTGLANRTSVHYHLSALEKEGLVRRERNIRKRVLRPTPKGVLLIGLLDEREKGKHED